jgi:alkylation response protein AidB-like acyl-CoA dehydrogenase
MSIQFLPSDEQRMLRESVHRWVQPIDVRQCPDFTATWQQIAEMGWLAAGLPEEAGGLGGDLYDTAIIAEELGAGLVRVPFVDVTALSSQVLLAVAPQRLATVVSGESVTLVAHDEPDSRGDPEWTRTTARQQSGTWLLSGQKSGVVGAPHAHSLICTATVAGSGLSFFELQQPAAVLQPYQTFDDRPAGDLLLQEAPARLLGAQGVALPVLEAALDCALVIESAESVGAMQKAFELTRDYLATRKQYGQRIGDFQALRHLLADMYIELEQARSMVLRGLDALRQSNSRQRSAVASATKARVAQSGLRVAGQAIQLHGGIGLAQEHPVGHFFNRLLAFNQRHGTAEEHVVRFADLTRG